MQNISSLSVLLIHFEAIYRYEGVRAAAHKTGIPLCRLSRSLNDLEKITNKKLFYSDKNEFKPTREGTRLYQEVDTNSMLINLSHQLNSFLNHESIKACVLPQVKMNLSGEIISNFYHYRKEQDKVLSVTVTSEHFDEQEMSSQLRACDLDMVLSYYRFDSGAIENKELYIDQFSFYKVKNNVELNENISYLAMLDLGSTGSSNMVTNFIESKIGNGCEDIEFMPRLVLPDIESLIKTCEDIPLIVVLNKSALRSFLLSGINLEVLPKLGSLELPVYVSYHKMNPKKKVLKKISDAYLRVIRNENPTKETFVI
ncbi:LysR family transcriptional regulator [Vibrio coralliilyticus]|uniref:helix-turn-helix domain-containing protein n=1 Tax=Vibrio coralliilyticus TaxID=190893 RepID=UPI00155FF4BF|nr:LysR family transcriptional regulator [Vibrio coralliilyticus]NRF28146.1 LysR family transcriptional regulator [Vibrio coralliilyticus]NRF82270.1 LysR family transcriptional regulator [Vibrio coralliilyticus]